MLGVSGVSSDMRDLDAAAKSGDARAQWQSKYMLIALKYMVSYAAALGGLDILIFTGGENQGSMRAKVCRRTQFLGIK